VDPLDALRDLAARPWDEWQRFVDANRRSRAQVEEGVRICAGVPTPAPGNRSTRAPAA
jgi:hypothetical protein